MVVGCQQKPVITQLEVGRGKLLEAGLALEAIEHLKRAEEEEVNKFEPRALLLIAYSYALLEGIAEVHDVESQYQEERTRRVTQLSEFEIKEILKIINQRHRVQKAAIQLLIDKGEDVVPLLVDNLVSGRYQNVHRDFAQILTAIGSKGLDELMTAVTDANTPITVKVQFVRIIGDIGDSSATSGLESVMETSMNAGLKMELNAALYLLGNTKYKENIIAGLTDSNLNVRQAAAKSMAVLNEPPTAAMVTALKDSDDTVRRDIAKALQKHPHPSAIDNLIELLTSNASPNTKLIGVNTLNLYAENGIANGLAGRLIALLTNPDVVNHEDRIRIVQLLKKPPLLKQIEEADKYDNLPSQVYDYYANKETNGMVKEVLNELLLLIPELPE